VVNLPQAATNTGNWNSGMPFTSSLGCGTWGGNSASENIALKHYLNNTWMISEIPYRKPTDEELFAGFTPRA
jgi:sulfoacetaldehyde dehydrogenase